MPSRFRRLRQHAHRALRDVVARGRRAQHHRQLQRRRVQQFVVELAAVANGQGSTTTTVVGSSLNPSTSGASVTFTATVTGSAPRATSPSPATAAASAAARRRPRAAPATAAPRRAAPRRLTVATHSIVASYAGDSANGASTSAPLSQVVNSGGRTPTRRARKLAQSLDLRRERHVHRHRDRQRPDRQRRVHERRGGHRGLRDASLSGSGNSRTATCTTSALTVATHAIVATYAGNAPMPVDQRAPSQVVNSGGAAPRADRARKLAPIRRPPARASRSPPRSTAPPRPATSRSRATPSSICRMRAQASREAATAALRRARRARSPSATHAIVASYAGNGEQRRLDERALSQVVNSASTPRRPRRCSDSTHNPSPAGAASRSSRPSSRRRRSSTAAVSFTANGAPIAGCATFAIVALGGTHRDLQREPTERRVQRASQATAATRPTSRRRASCSRKSSRSRPSATRSSSPRHVLVNETRHRDVTVTRIGDASAPAQAVYDRGGGTATPGADFIAPSGLLSGAANDAIDAHDHGPHLDDGTAKATKLSRSSLSNPVGAALGTTSSTTVTIFDDENAPPAMPGIATVVNNPYGTGVAAGRHAPGNTISSLSTTPSSSSARWPGRRDRSRRSTSRASTSARAIRSRSAPARRDRPSTSRTSTRRRLPSRERCWRRAATAQVRPGSSCKARRASPSARAASSAAPRASRSTRSARRSLRAATWSTRARWTAERASCSRRQRSTEAACSSATR